jgi:hypothetical protein
LIILHSFAVIVEQLCAQSADAPSREKLRPKHCGLCGQAVRDAQGKLQIVGHGMYNRQVCGLAETGLKIIWVRRFLCLVCGHTISRLPDWLHPYRWYAARVIVEALYRHCVLQESARVIGVRFGRPPEATEWRSPRRWRAQLLVSPTLWGWLGPRLGITGPAMDREEGRGYLSRLLAEGGQLVHSGLEAIGEIPTTVRRTLQNLVYRRKSVGSGQPFPPGHPGTDPSGPGRQISPTEENSGARSP